MKKIIIIVFLLASSMCFGQSDSARGHVKKADSTASPKPAFADTLKSKPTATGGLIDTIKHRNADSSVRNADTSLAKNTTGLAVEATINNAEPLQWAKDTVFARMLNFSIGKNIYEPLVHEGDVRVPEGKEELFYMLAGLVFFIGAVKMAYPKYFQDIFRMFIQTSQRQKQTPEQIVQGYVPGFLFNILFFMVGGMLITLYGIKINYETGPIWLLSFYCAGILAAIYLVKYSVTALAGWVFNVKDAAATYTFIIFLVNRVIGILGLPLLVLIAFYDGDINTVLFTIAASLVFFLLVYRYALSLAVIRKNLKVSALHFFIYLCAVELMPLLVVYKVLFNQFHSK